MIYFDQAATSYYRPDCVVTAVMGDIEPPSKEHMETLKKAVHAVSGLDCQIGG